MAGQQARQAPAFPPEVWHLVARHLSMRQWAQVAGTCKATWNLQLDEIRLTSTEVEEGMAWIVKRGRKARMLEVGQFSDSSQTIAAAQALLLAGGSWDTLRTLKIMCAADVSILVRASFFSAVTWVLGQAKELRFLRLKVDSLLCLPQLAQLRHLQLTVTDGLHQRLEHSLTMLTNLQTLFLKQGVLAVDPHTRVSLPLAGLSQLQSVKLSNVVPGTLTLPKAAALHLRLRDMECAREDVWRGVASAMQSVTITDGGTILSASELPSFLTGPSGLKSIILCLQNFGLPDSRIELSGSFLDVAHLVVQCSGHLCMHIPAGQLLWDLLKVVSGRMLAVSLANIDDFIQSWCSFSFAYKLLHGADLLILCHDMGQYGGRVASADCGAGGGHEIHSTCTPPFYQGWNLYSFQYLCQCGACPACSKQRGSCGEEALNF